MGYNMGTVGPIVYDQDNSGTSTDITTPVTYTPEMFGAPPGAQIITAWVQQQVSISRGSAAVQNYLATPVAINFDVWTQAAGGGIFGHHSGHITVSTTFHWWSYSAAPGMGPETAPSEKEAARMLHHEWI